MKKPRGILFDIDGVLLRWKEAIPGAVDALRHCDGRGIPYRLITNATRRSRAAVSRDLAGAGFVVREEMVLTPIASAAHIIRREGWNPHYLVIDEVAADLPTPDRTRPADVVFVGDLGAKFTFETLNEAFGHLKKGARLMAAHRNRFWFQEKEPVLDAGPFVAALEYAAGVEAEVIGKPSRAFFDAAREELSGGDGGNAVGPAAPIAMIGDRWDSDVEGARAAGLIGILVRTGAYEKGDEKKGAPDAVLDSVADLPEWLEK